MMEKPLSILARAFSLSAALAITCAVLIFPRMIALDMHSVPHGWLVVLMFGMSFGYVHGFGFTPKKRVLRILFSPLISWPLMAIGSVKVFTLSLF